MPAITAAFGITEIINSETYAVDELGLLHKTLRNDSALFPIPTTWRHSNDGRNNDVTAPK